MLILAELSHASPRIPAIAKYLPEFGWRATIISGTPAAETEPYRVVTTGLPDTDERVKRLLRLSPGDSLQEQLGVRAETRNDPLSPMARAVGMGKAILNYPDQHRGWIGRARNAAVEEMKGAQFDALISSSSPVSAHIAASRVTRETGIPWIADYRDLWSRNHNYQFGRVRKALDRRRELSCLRHASGIVTCTPDWVVSLQQLHGRSDVFLVTNGYDPDLIPTARSLGADSFVLASTGPVYPGEHNAQTLLTAIARLVAEENLAPGEMRMRFVGIPDPLVQADIERMGLRDYVAQEGEVTRGESMRIQWDSTALIMFTWANAEAGGHYPLRTFEYLATGKPILVMTRSPGAAAATLVMSSGCGYLCSDEESTYRHLSALYLQNLGGTGAGQEDRSVSHQFSYREKAKEFARILNMVA